MARRVYFEGDDDEPVVIEKTSKVYKAWQAGGCLTMLGSMFAFVLLMTYMVQMPRTMQPAPIWGGLIVWLGIAGFVVFVTARVMAWWNHG